MFSFVKKKEARGQSEVELQGSYNAEEVLAILRQTVQKCVEGELEGDAAEVIKAYAEAAGEIAEDEQLIRYALTSSYNGNVIEMVSLPGNVARFMQYLPGDVADAIKELGEPLSGDKADREYGGFAQLFGQAFNAIFDSQKISVRFVTERATNPDGSIIRSSPRLTNIRLINHRREQRRGRGPTGGQNQATNSAEELASFMKEHGLAESES